MNDATDALKAMAGGEEWLPFYGVDNNMFKLAGTVLEAVEDEDDGYRSYLRSIEARPDAKAIFPAKPITHVRVREIERPSTGGSDRFEGYELYDASGHVWLTIGTDAYDDYYPCFTFTYEPSGEMVT